MANSKKKEKAIVLLLVGVALLMAVGFAAYNSTLNITGNVNVKPANWSVHFVTSGASSYTETSGSEAASVHTITDTNFAFTVLLESPGDFYETTLTVINDGTFAAQLKKITMSTLTAEQQKYLTYSITYNNGTSYTTTTDNINAALAINGTATVKVRVEYILPDSESDLPQAAEGQTTVPITVTGQLDYVKATN